MSPATDTLARTPPATSRFGARRSRRQPVRGDQDNRALFLNAIAWLGGQG